VHDVSIAVFFFGLFSSVKCQLSEQALCHIEVQKTGFLQCTYRQRFPKITRRCLLSSITWTSFVSWSRTLY